MNQGKYVRGIALDTGNAESHKPSLVVSVHVSKAAGLLRGQLSYGRQRGFDVTLVCSSGELASQIARDEGIRLVNVEMEREIAPIKDLISLAHVFRALRMIRPDIVNAGTLKAGFIMMVGAALSGVPCRIYTMRGLRFETLRGVKRLCVQFTERLTCVLAHRVICISPSLHDHAVRIGMVSGKKAVVLGKGSSNGVDTECFSATPARRNEAKNIRHRLGIGQDDLVIGFVGRIVCDKGIKELSEAWEQLRVEYANTHLLVIGSPETGDPVDPIIMRSLQMDPRVHFVGHVHGRTDLADYYAAIDVLALPTYREGFGNALMEAASMGIPVVSSRIPGCVDAVEDGRTGTLVEPRNASELLHAIGMYLDNPALRAEHGQAGALRARRYFRRESIWQALYDEYARLLTARGLMQD